METFKQTVLDWLRPYGYEVHSHNSTWSYIMLTNYNHDTAPSIACNSEGAILSYPGLKLFIKLEAGPIAIGHRDIERYIDIMAHYAYVCEEFNPFNIILKHGDF